MAKIDGMLGLAARRLVEPLRDPDLGRTSDPLR
jgi:hypothetical protein